MSEENQLEKRAMVIVAHPDDAEFGCSGTVATWTDDGWYVHYVIVTDGTAGGGDEATDVGPEARAKVAATRKEEQIAACAEIGVTEITFLDQPDGQIFHTLKLRKEIVRLIRTHRPSRIICMAPVVNWEPQYMIGLYHPDHLAVAETTVAAIYPAAQNPWDFPELLMDEGLKPHKVSEIWFLAAPNSNTHIDITAVVDRKIASLRAHDSQLGANFERLEKMIRGWMAESGKRHDVEYAEEFHVAQNWRPDPEDFPADSDAELAHQD